MNLPNPLPRWAAVAVAALSLAAPPASHACSSCEEDEGDILPLELWQRLYATHADVEEDPDAPQLLFAEPRTGFGPARQSRIRPQGALSGRIVFIGAGHGWTYDNTNAQSNQWFTQRGNSNGVVEDYGNLDQMTTFAQYLWNAGATVVSTRPIGYQRNEVILDQDDTTLGTDGIVTYTGAWSLSSGTPAYAKPPDSAGDTYRFVLETTTGEPTRTARYTPNIPAAGVYPVYTWVLNSSNRVNQEYLVHHVGGTTSVRVNHRMVGKGWVWLGSYYFHQGMQGSVEITNRIEAGETGSAVIADAIRFGNGMGSLSFAPDNVVSGFPREEECSRYWAQISQFPSSVYLASTTHQSDNVGTPPRMAAYMNNEAVGAATDRVYISFHSNAGGGRGAVGLYNSESVNRTVNQIALADFLGREVNEDFQQLDVLLFPGYPRWSTRTTHIFQRSDIEFGELLAGRINNEMDATINEVAFHDNADDARYLKDPRARRLLSRATLDGTIRYFSQFGGAPLVFPPDEPTNLRARSANDGTGDILLDWQAPVVRQSTKPGTPGPLTGGAPTGYQVFVGETGGYDFRHLTDVAGTSARITGQADGAALFFIVQAVNAGGVSFPSNVAGATVRSTRPPVLIVDGFDRLDDALAHKQRISGISGRSNLGDVTRPLEDLSNNFSYVAPAGRSVAASPRWNAFDSCTNDAVLAGQVALADYRAVVWILGEESTADETFSTAEQTLVSNFVAGGGHLFVSGSEIAWDLDNRGTAGDKAFFNNVLRSAYVGDSAGTWQVQGLAGSIFAGQSFRFDDGTFGNYNAEFADRLAPRNGGVAAMGYVGGTGDTAAIVHDGAGGSGRLVVLGFPFETIVGESSRNAVMAAALDYFAASEPDILVGDVTGDGTVTPLDAQLIFQCYIHDTCAHGLEAAAADVCPAGGDGVVTPRDAHGAFLLFLGLPACP
ncbi:MAG: hypothetical protein KF858_12060 [Candidatus Sumerlaeia bacterium]|nr:hypothetical protein [Candidatus Sumerlaeia bacterium]